MQQRAKVAGRRNLRDAVPSVQPRRQRVHVHARPQRCVLGRRLALGAPVQLLSGVAGEGAVGAIRALLAVAKAAQAAPAAAAVAQAVLCLHLYPRVARALQPPAVFQADALRRAASLIAAAVARVVAAVAAGCKRHVLPPVAWPLQRRPRAAREKHLAVCHTLGSLVQRAELQERRAQHGVHRRLSGAIVEALPLLQRPEPGGLALQHAGAGGHQAAAGVHAAGSVHDAGRRGAPPAVAAGKVAWAVAAPPRRVARAVQVAPLRAAGLRSGMRGGAGQQRKRELRRGSHVTSKL